MNRLTKWIVAPIAASALFLLQSSTASAQYGVPFGRGLSISIGSGGYNAYSPGYGQSCDTGYGAGYGFSPWNRYSAGYGGYGLHHSSFRNHGIGHYDYHPTQVYRHGHHFDVVPGHHDYHNPGLYNGHHHH